MSSYVLCHDFSIDNSQHFVHGTADRCCKEMCIQALRVTMTDMGHSAMKRSTATAVKNAVDSPVSRLDGLLDFPASFIVDAGACSKGDQRHFIFISHSLSGDVDKVVHLRDQRVTFTFCLSTIIPEFLKGAATTHNLVMLRISNMIHDLDCLHESFVIVATYVRMCSEMSQHELLLQHNCCYNTIDNLTILEARKIVLLLCARNEQSKQSVTIYAT